MNDFDAWIFFDGPMPESLRPVVDALRDPLSEDEELELRALMDRLDAKLPPPSEADAAPVARRAADLAPASPTPGAPALQKEEKAPDPPPAVARVHALAATARSPEEDAAFHAAMVAVGMRPAPEVRVAGAQEHPRTAQLPVMDPSQGARRPPPELSMQVYVAYRAELEVWPELRADFHRKYKVEGEAAYQEVVRVWEGHLAAAPTARAIADAMYASYLAEARRMRREGSGGA